MLGLCLFIGSVGSTFAQDHNSLNGEDYSDDKLYLLNVARDTWSSINYCVDQETGIPYDNSGKEDYTGIDKIGFYIASLSVAKELGFISEEEALEDVTKTLKTLEGLSTWNANGTPYESSDIKIPYAWYYMATLEPKPPTDIDVCSIDLGNYYACLIIGRNAFPELNQNFSKLLDGIDWSLLYDYDEDVFYGGYNTQTRSYSTWYCKDLASDSQTASFLGIATESFPAKHWEKLSRCFEERYGYKYYKPGWEGGLFMQYLPGIFIDQSETLIGKSSTGFTLAQIAHSNQINAPVWGWSPSCSPQSSYYIGYGQLEDDIVTPHASVLAIIYFDAQVVENLKALEHMGARDPILINDENYNFGFRDSINWTNEQSCEKYLTLDQAMILLSIANYLDETTWGLFMNDTIYKNGIRLIEDYNGRTIYFAEGEDWSEQHGGGIDLKSSASNCSCLGNSWGNGNDSAKYSMILNDDEIGTIFKIRYSDSFDAENTGNRLSIYLDGQLKGDLSTMNTEDWNTFKWSDGVDVGDIPAGEHEIEIISQNGVEWNCINLDCFKLFRNS